MTTNKVIGQHQIGPYTVLSLEPSMDEGIKGVIACRKVKIKGIEYDVVPSHDIKYTIAIDGNTSDNFIGETIEYY